MNNQELKIPYHVGIIMDGNGRWATDRGLPRKEGHNAGAKTLKKLAKYIKEKGVKVLSIYAFSTENFKRDKEEVNHLMNLFVSMIQSEFKTLVESGAKIVFSGRKYPLNDDVLAAMDKVTVSSEHNTEFIINVCLNYGAHAEIIDAVKGIVADVNCGNKTIDDITEDNFVQYLYQDLPPIDFLIRTSGENRLSNFMLWQASYAEFYFPTFHFPDFTNERFDECLIEYTRRDRRFGGNKKA